MKQWKIKYWAPRKSKGPIEKWFDKLTKEQFKSLAKEIMMLEQVGNELKLPHSKALGKGLFELRERQLQFLVSDYQSLRRINYENKKL
jgi:hypothetical protein